MSTFNFIHGIAIFFAVGAIITVYAMMWEYSTKSGNISTVFNTEILMATVFGTISVLALIVITFMWFRKGHGFSVDKLLKEETKLDREQEKVLNEIDETLAQ